MLLYHVNESQSPVPYTLTPIIPTDALGHEVTDSNYSISVYASDDTKILTALVPATDTGYIEFKNAGTSDVVVKLISETLGDFELDRVRFVIEHGPAAHYTGGSLVFDESLGEPEVIEEA